MRRKRDKPRIALRPDGDDATDVGADLDDVVVNDVSVFRAELMDDDWLWMCCYLAGEGWENRIAFAVRAVKVKGKKRPRIQFTATEYPSGVTYEEKGLSGPGGLGGGGKPGDDDE